MTGWDKLDAIPKCWLEGGSRITPRSLCGGRGSPALSLPRHRSLSNHSDHSTCSLIWMYLGAGSQWSTWVGSQWTQPQGCCCLSRADIATTAAVASVTWIGKSSFSLTHVQKSPRQKWSAYLTGSPHTSSTQGACYTSSAREFPSQEDWCKFKQSHCW